tara:strand:- start:448 stop:702 length:255 start_codon:yes stop_codon:yes gene_type:complete
MQGLLIGIANAITGILNVGVTPSYIFAIYKARVIADGGVVENDACAIAFLTSIGAGPLPPVPSTLSWGLASARNWGEATSQIWG